ncbi:hypothetical protein BDW22DRAFT_205476 [Trametopsis cervina]|nr:hypothetical protein BDW22DRAFT_205476 [Trametopsis cervina]
MALDVISQLLIPIVRVWLYVGLLRFDMYARATQWVVALPATCSSHRRKKGYCHTIHT